MKTLLVLSLLFASLSTHSSDDSREQGIGFLALFCPVCAVGAVINESNEKADKKTAPESKKETSASRDLASEND